ncbi:uncharacterized protein LOC126570859 [Anopheles aquasalis]|uniref:uncharacterized protein LOC126570859 n=1 Tax=Anopheles aquasalis TaxID=42839 RepID=UPI00215A5AD4|nr:uncharacterized protein LOC126570859 [Anopheles aquasalis]
MNSGTIDTGHEEIPLQSNDEVRSNEQEVRPTNLEEIDAPEAHPSIDTQTIAGLVTIVTVNLHQLDQLLQVGPGLGVRYIVSLVLLIISLVSVFVVVVVRRVLERHGLKIKPKSKRILQWTNDILTGFIFVSNLLLQITTDLSNQCQVLLNQPLPFESNRTN